MKEVHESELPVYMQHTFLKHKIDIMFQGVKDAGLEKELLEFIKSTEINDALDCEDIFVKFAKKYHDKFYIVPEEERINKVYFAHSDRKLE